MAKLPKGKKVGFQVTRIHNVKGNRRKITWKRVRPHGKNKNLTWKIISNKKA